MATNRIITKRKLRIKLNVGSDNKVLRRTKVLLGELVSRFIVSTSKMVGKKTLPLLDEVLTNKCANFSVR